MLWPLGGCLVLWGTCSVVFLAKERIPVNLQMGFGEVVLKLLTELNFVKRGTCRDSVHPLGHRLAGGQLQAGGWVMLASVPWRP